MGHSHIAATAKVTRNETGIYNPLVDLMGHAQLGSKTVLYLHEAALTDAAPSGTGYTDGQGASLASLGVHEHWNNGADKLYSRNLGAEEGIELIRVNLTM